MKTCTFKYRRALALDVKMMGLLDYRAFALQPSQKVLS